VVVISRPGTLCILSFYDNCYLWWSSVQHSGIQRILGFIPTIATNLGYLKEKKNNYNDNRYNKVLRRMFGPEN
jgi:hypothetical protein